MAARLRFLGTGSAETRGVLSEAGFLVESDKSLIMVDPGPGAAQALAAAKILEVDRVVVTESRGHDASLLKVKKRPGNVEVVSLPGGVVFRLTDGRVSYVFGAVSKELSADVVVVASGKPEVVIKKLRPRLAVLTHFSASQLQANPVYVARELQKKTGVQTIAAHDGLVVDLLAYGAVSEQKSLSKFE
ncbi:hypothetical protein HY489_01965 [Candidatus Woesearchaeota archaeon]|nr:hypothetical protein [Candidatus Woesearchaeota archaeon]